MDSNGLAAHPTLDAALLHGLLEVIERHALPDRWPQKPKGVPAPFDIPGFLLRAFDLTPPGCPVPVAGALLHDGERVLTAGYAARLDAGDAVRAACEEAFQSRLTDVQGAREDVAHRVDEIPAQLRLPPTHRMKSSRCRNVRALARALKRPVAYVELAPGRLPLRV